ncbi:A disintegrin and metalloproteinase with thrombospondin motifs 20 isoform X3 [Manis pentadactyla]|uniref:A disintegrin and metalloproteinase with thrombospondin motifs 20 isoform X3 n=1 Tax=Manis pentadactyla TaxID=143292 RepID=UPI00255D10F8|nr:A disintegrin and metalloproteinase with thrombospondin motifs 20 isoform X3 [Manis pentadactyla]
MRAAEWLPGLLCQLALVVTRSWETRLHPRQEALVRTLASYEVVTPVRVTELGEVFPQGRHFSRRRRSPEAPEPPPRRTHYRLRAYGQLFQLDLRADAAFLGAGYAEVHLGGPAPGPEGHRAAPADLRHCFYRGRVNAQRARTAVFSLCGGLMGTFKAHDGDYFLEPLMKVDGSEHEDDSSKPHLIYRRELKRSCFLQSHKPCEVSDIQIKKTTLPFHNRSNMHEDLNIKKEIILGDPSSSMSLEHERSQLHSRKKRFLSYPRYVEVMVSADAKMVHHHGQNLQHYVLTLMSIVAAIYKDSSIGNLINIVIVKLVVIHNEQEGPVISFNAATTLHNFCLWQQTQNVLDDAHPAHHDTAVLITREDICGATEKCDTLGLAELGTLCDPLRSCSVSEENGLSAAFTIAHELGHVFNVPHDDSFKCKETGIKHQYHVMAPTLNYHTSPWTWSKCSQKYITEFLDTGRGECLLDRPSGRAYDLPPQLPGLTYDGDKQCELTFGPGSQVCPYLKQCRRLWCTGAGGAHHGCRTQHMPLADGTNCGPGMHCHHGLCVNREMESRPVDGEWGPWGPYSSCSRTCGGGIKHTARLCDRPEPRNGGRFCVGRRVKFRSCNTGPCPGGGQDFRGQQCSGFDGRHFNIDGLSPNVRWLPKYSGIAMKDRCKLYCRAAGTADFYQLKDRVADGTPCGAETNDVCVQGLCRQAGCDHVLNSKARRDKCGVCGGDSSSCRTMAGVFTSARYGYNVVVKIPTGATSVDIVQHSYSGKPEDDNYLALSDTRGNFLLNGNFVVSMSKKEINIQGAIFEYSGSNNSIERINSTDRLEEELVLQVLCVGNLYNPDVRYSFNIPMEEGSDLFTWDPYGPWQDCTKMCQGLHRRRITCVRRSDHMLVSDQRCDHLPLPLLVTERCNTDCELGWHVVSRSECSSRCGQGHRSLDVHCMRYSVHKGQTVPVGDRHCSDQLKPPTREPCRGGCVTARWHYSEWSQCSRSCGGGERSRESYCVNGLGHRLADRECQELPRVMREICNEFSCPIWATSEWSECLVTCGKGTAQRQVWCQLHEGPLSDGFCNPSTKPESLKSCELHTCASWQVGAWGSCSATCGHGYQTRAVKCVTELLSTELDDSVCPSSNRPPDGQDCIVTPCPVIPEIEATSLPAVPTGEMAQWRHGSWTPCSASCGKGLKYREVLCIDQFQGKLEEKYCSHLRKPRTHKACRSARCPSWKANRWKECPVTCGSGVQHRDVYCRLRGTGRVAEEMCGGAARPHSQRQCWRQDCTQYQWVAGEWLQCSASCKKKETHRQVTCIDARNSHVNDSFCDPSTRPPSVKTCRSRPCRYLVVTGDSSQCAGNCGFSYRQRITYCIGIQSTEKYKLRELWPVDYRECPVPPSPQVYKCNFRSCLHMATWKVGKWSKCSVTCGTGVMERRVECVAENGWSSDLCLRRLKPDAQKKCYVSDCKTLSSCREIQVKNNITKDGDYYVNIKGRIIKIHCAGMQLENPKEYLSLVKGEEDNFSEVYGFRLHNPYECPFNGTRRQDCECKNDYLAGGHTVFSKIRIDLTSMQIKTTDLLFAQTLSGRAVPFATAGDCYSAARCPQGQFSINLAGTGMKISGRAKWLAQGSHASAVIRRSQDGTKVHGRCGGFCGKCVPHMTTGLPIQVI